MSLLGLLFERNKTQAGSEPEETPQPEHPGTVADIAAEESLHGEPNIDQIRNELAEIAKLIGPGDSYDILAESDVNMTSVDIAMGEIKSLAPHAFSSGRIAEVPDQQTVTVFFNDLFDQLQNGVVEATVTQLLGEVNEEYRAENFEDIKEDKIALPLQIILNSIRPEELVDRTTKVERDPELAAMPDVFTLPGVTERSAPANLSENRIEEESTGGTGGRSVIPFRPSAAPSNEVLKPAENVSGDLGGDGTPLTSPELENSSLTEEIPDPAMDTVEPEGKNQELETNEILENEAPEAPFEMADSVEETSENWVEEPAEEQAEVPLEVPESLPLAAQEAAEEWVEDVVEEQAEAPDLEVPESLPLAAQEAAEEWVEDTVEEQAEAPGLEVSEPSLLNLHTSAEEFEEEESEVQAFEIPKPCEIPQTALEASASLSPSLEGHQSLADLDRLMKQAERDAKPSEYTPPMEDVPQVSTVDTGDELRVRNVDINTAEPEELVSRLDGIGPKLAIRIVEDREINGRFADLYDLARVQGIGAKIFESITGLAWREDLCGRREILANILDSSKDNIPDIKGVSARLALTKGFEGCVIAHSEGYVLASSWEHSKNEALGAFAPQMFKKVVQYISRLELGEMDAFTFFFDQFPITLVRHGDIFLAAIHSPNRYSRRHVQIARTLTAELSRRLQRIRDF